MYMVRRDHIVEDEKSETFLSFKEPVDITSTVARKLQEKILLVAAMSNMPDMARQKVAVAAWHRFS
jgi:hypothetical protein